MMNDEKYVSYLGGEPPDRSRLFYFTPEQLAVHLSVTRRTVYRWLTSGKMKGLRAGAGWRIPEREVGRFLGEQGYGFSPELAADNIEEKTGTRPEEEPPAPAPNLPVKES